MGQPHLLPRIRAALLASLNGYGVTNRIAAMIDDFIVQPGLGHNAGPLGALALAIDAREAASR